jgi:hypothetical protein
MKRMLILSFLGFFLAACVAAMPPETFPATRRADGSPFALRVETGTPALTLPPTTTVTMTETLALPSTSTMTPTSTATPTPGPTLSPTSNFPAEGYGPSNFPANIDPLTGLKVDNPSLLDRRPMIVKVANLPRDYRPQWGLSKADQVFEYYIEEGTTRFAAVFLGKDASMVAPIRSGRLFDNHLISMYKANFAFGSADYRVRNLLYNEPYADRLVVESYCPPMCRYLPGSLNYLMTNTADLTTYIDHRKVSGGNKRQNLDGFSFNYQTPLDGEPATRVFVRYSSAIYNRWDYAPESGKYFRYSDVENDFENGKNEIYQQLTDRLTGEPISADNVVVMVIPHKYILRTPEIVDIIVSGPGKAYLFRDGEFFELRWYRNAKDQLFTLVDKEGQTFPLKPGNTWFEVVSTSTKMKNMGEVWRFTFMIP